MFYQWYQKDQSSDYDQDGQQHQEMKADCHKIDKCRASMGLLGTKMD